MNRDFSQQWERIDFQGVPVYVNPERPDWFVPNPLADRLLKQLVHGEPNGDHPAVLQLLDRIRGNGKPPDSYPGRAAKRTPENLRECWLHLTNQCNQNCTHCMFDSSPRSGAELKPRAVQEIIGQALALGSRIFYFTGGEPLLSGGFYPGLHAIFSNNDTHAVVLTNLTLIGQHLDSLAQFPSQRLHFQVSIDGLGKNHDLIRGKGASTKLATHLETLIQAGFPCTLAMSVTRHNADDMEKLVDFAAKTGVSNIHYLWLFKKGRAEEPFFIPAEEIFPRLTAAQEKAEKKHIKIDNIEILRSQVFSFPGTKYDLSNAGWQSLAIGPEGNIYPTPALIFTPRMVCGHIEEGLEKVWRSSPKMQELRNASLIRDPLCSRDAFKFLIGGGDIDHSFVNTGEITGGDPYLELYKKLAQWLITREALQYPDKDYPALLLKMGEVLAQCPVEGTEVFFTHSNCVLSLPGHDTHSLVNAFYTEAAVTPRQDILNPVCYPDELIRHIPESLRFRNYGCGSPVLEANIQPGESMVDLGCGTGIECFIASRLIGSEGSVVGIDMGDEMLRVANRSKEQILQPGFSPVTFKKALLEDLPITGTSVDLVISNCVVNLSPNKRKVFSEIFRILKPGGRLVISDISYDDDIPLSIKYNEKLRGECIGGALGYRDLFGLLEDLGFTGSRILKGYLYRTIKGFDFYSLTYEAFKTEGKHARHKPLPPFKEVLAAVESVPTCSCFVKPEDTMKKEVKKKPPFHTSGCMVCGEELRYLETGTEQGCYYCGNIENTDALCIHGHFVCDRCHRAHGLELIKQVCLNSTATDMVVIMDKIRSHPGFCLHGPEHHSLVPAVILTAYRNSGATISKAEILKGIDRGAAVPGGSCAFMGACGAAIGVGIAFAVILHATPLQGKNRQTVQQITQRVLGKIAQFDAPRCCQRDCWLALQEAALLSGEILDRELVAGNHLVCQQYKKNKECIHEQCPLWPPEPIINTK
jgi:7,8-dihydro-6-hydroxymethylpterin dimethyltransferase